MKKLVIIGAGGMGRSVYCIALGCIGYDENFIIKGFIDDNLKSATIIQYTIKGRFMSR